MLAKDQHRGWAEKRGGDWFGEVLFEVCFVFVFVYFVRVCFICNVCTYVVDTTQVMVRVIYTLYIELL